MKKIFIYTIIFFYTTQSCFAMFNESGNLASVESHRYGPMFCNSQLEQPRGDEFECVHPEERKGSVTIRDQKVLCRKKEEHEIFSMFEEFLQEIREFCINDTEFSELLMSELLVYVKQYENCKINELSCIKKLTSCIEDKIMEVEQAEFIGDKILKYLRGLKAQLIFFSYRFETYH